jgi:hypothetical protein
MRIPWCDNADVERLVQYAYETQNVGVMHEQLQNESLSDESLHHNIDQRSNAMNKKGETTFLMDFIDLK